MLERALPSEYIHTPLLPSMRETPKAKKTRCRRYHIGLDVRAMRQNQKPTEHVSLTMRVKQDGGLEQHY